MYDEGRSTALEYHATGLVSRNTVCCLNKPTHYFGSDAVHVLNMSHSKFAWIHLLQRPTCIVLVVGSLPSLSHRSPDS